MSKSPDQFVAHMATHQREVYRYIVALTPSISDADDVFQETSLVLWREYETFDESTNFAAWACKIAYYRVLAHRTRMSRDRHVFSEQLLGQLAERREQIGNTLSLRREALGHCLGLLTPHQRDLIEIRYGNDASVKEVAERSGRNTQTMYKTLRRLRIRLMACVDDRLARKDTP